MCDVNHDNSKGLYNNFTGIANEASINIEGLRLDLHFNWNATCLGIIQIVGWKTDLDSILVQTGIEEKGIASKNKLEPCTTTGAINGDADWFWTASDDLKRLWVFGIHFSIGLGLDLCDLKGPAAAQIVSDQELRFSNTFFEDKVLGIPGKLDS